MRHREIVKKRYHSFFILFNPSEEVTPWDDIEDDAVRFSLELMNEGEYGTLPSTSFHFFLEKEMNLRKQEDHIQTVNMIGFPPSIQLTLHINYDVFIQSDKERQFQITVNGVLYLLKYWKENLKVPKKLPLAQVIEIYQKRLEAEGLLISDEECRSLYFKNKQTFHFHLCNELRQGLATNAPLFEVAEAENLFNNSLSRFDFGKSVTDFYFLYEIFDFKNPEISNLYLDESKKIPYAKKKYLYVLQQFDSNRFLYDENGNEQTVWGQICYLQEGILEAVLRINKMKNRPKDFNVDLFYQAIDQLLTDYIEKRKLMVS